MSKAVEVTNEGSFIPATQRPDGSWRKPRRVKDGYIPQEEVPLYESKGKQWANNQNRQYPVGLDPSIIKAREEAKAQTSRSPIPGLVIGNEGKKKKKKKKSSEQEVNGQLTSKMPMEKVTTSKDNADEWKTVQSKSVKTGKTDAVNVSNNPVTITDPAKRIKNLKKKLREIEAIETKISSGEVKKPDKDQLEKISRKEELLSEIFALELSLKE